MVVFRLSLTGPMFLEINICSPPQPSTMSLSALANQPGKIFPILRSSCHYRGPVSYYLKSQHRMEMSTAGSIEVPDGFRLHTENTSYILLSANDAFLNPVQEFNRDISVACIRTWSEDRNREKEQAWRKMIQGKMAKASGKPNKKLKGVIRKLYRICEAKFASRR